MKYIIYFPGFNERTLVNFYEQMLLENGTKLHIDHFTVDESLRTWHIKLEEKQTMFKTLKTKSVDEYNFLWFILRVNSLESLESSPNKLVMTLESTENEIKRRSEIINEARQNALFQATELIEDLDKQFFWQFEFFINRTQDQSHFPQVPVSIQGNPGEIKDARTEARMRTHQIFLDGFDGSIIIRVSKIIGNVSTPIQFISGHEIYYSQ